MLKLCSVILFPSTSSLITGMIAALDEAVGNITDALRDKGFMDNALIIFTTDVRLCSY